MGSGAGDGSARAPVSDRRDGVDVHPALPDIEGVADFAGRTVHTAAWDDDYDLTGRRVGVIGTGATAVQPIPELAEEVADLTVYQRTPIHVTPKNDVAIPPVVRRLFARITAGRRAGRAIGDRRVTYEAGWVLTVLRYRRFWWLNRRARFSRACCVSLRSATGNCGASSLRPTHLGCKLAHLLNSYYRTFTKPNVHLHGRRASSGSTMASSRRTGQDRSTRWCWPPVSICGTPTSRPSGSSPRQPAISESGGANDSRPDDGFHPGLPQSAEPRRAPVRSH